MLSVFGQATSVLYLASQKCSERWRKKEVLIYNENPVACWIEKWRFSSILAPTLEQTGKRKRQISQMCHAPELQFHTGSFPVASRKQTTTIFPPFSKQGKGNDEFPMSFLRASTSSMLDAAL